MSGKNIKEIQAELQLNPGTWDNYYYLDKNGFRNFVLDVKKEFMLRQAEKTSLEILGYETTKKDTKLLQIKQKEAEFLRETQGKDLGYSKRIETIGFNINKNEPLDDKQRETLDKLLKKTGHKPIREAEAVEVKPEKPLDTTVI